MSASIRVACGFLGGIILSADEGYRVLQHPRPDRVFDRIADARWFLAVTWCDRCDTAAGILTHEGQLSFQNERVFAMGDTIFLPLEHRKAVFEACACLEQGETTTYELQTRGNPPGHRLEIRSLDVDPRYGKVAIVRAIEGDAGVS